MSSDGEEREAEEEVEEVDEFMEAEQRRFDAQLPMSVLPLYSLLSAEQQARVTIYFNSFANLKVIVSLFFFLSRCLLHLLRAFACVWLRLM